MLLKFGFRFCPVKASLPSRVVLGCGLLTPPLLIRLSPRVPTYARLAVIFQQISRSALSFHFKTCGCWTLKSGTAAFVRLGAVIKGCLGNCGCGIVRVV